MKHLKTYESFSKHVHDEYYIISDSLLDLFDEYNIIEWNSPSQQMPKGTYWTYLHNVGVKYGIGINNIRREDFNKIWGGIDRLKKSIEGRLGKKIKVTNASFSMEVQKIQISI